MAKMSIQFKVNGKPVEVHAFPMERLLDVIRDSCRLTGAKEGCGEGECGACGVFINGQLTNSCLVPVIQAQDADIETIEGLSQADVLSPVQAAFIKYGGAQCGICTPGMILAASQVLREHPHPTREQVREGLSGNLCRCTGYTKIVDSVCEALSEADS